MIICCQKKKPCDAEAKEFTVCITSEGLEKAEISLEVIDTPVPETVKCAGSSDLLVWTKSIKGYAEKLSGDMRIHDADINDFVPVNIFLMPWQTLEDGWNFYRKNVEISGEGKVLCNLFITELLYDEYEMWVNGKLVSADVNKEPRVEEDMPTPHTLNVDFECEAGGVAEITLLIKVAGISRAGISANRGKRVLFVVK